MFGKVILEIFGKVIPQTCSESKLKFERKKKYASENEFPKIFRNLKRKTSTRSGHTLCDFTPAPP